MSHKSSSAGVLGISLTPLSVTAASAAVATVWQRELALNDGANGSRELLGTAFADAARASGMEKPELVVVLMPPLAETRAIALPPLSEDDRNRFLARNAGRYFVAARGAQVVTSTATGAGKNGSASSAPSATLASSAAQLLTQAVHAASIAAGCELRSVVPAESAWAAAAVALWPVFARGAGYFVIARDGRADLLTLSHGRLDGVRRFRGAGDAVQMAKHIAHGGDRGSARVGVAGPNSAAHDMINALTAAGLRVLSPEPKWTALAEHPDALAARFAGDADGLEFRSDASVERGRARVKRNAWWALGAAAATLLLAAVVHYMGVKRELAHVQTSRAGVRTQVEATLVGRSSVDAAYRQVASLAGTSRSARRWSAVLADLAAYLPIDASLTAVRARGDSVFIDGVAIRAAPVFDAVARIPGVASVRATAPVRREAVEGEEPLEHFSLGAVLAGAKR